MNTENIMKSIKYILFLCIFPMVLFSQQSLELVNVFPSTYKFTAGLLRNGHFYINTKYIGDTTKQLIYREANTGITPINYTSHVHFKIDNIVFQLPFESDTVTQLPPPPNQLQITSLFRDSVQNIPRINATMNAVMPDGETIRFIFRMMPVKRPSGGFIRFIAELDSSSKQHDIGVLLLIDTKIGNNDRAPIITSVGYYSKEKEFTKTGPNGIPEYWLALEGSPQNPQLTARGNLQASELIVPDLFLFGNWSDFSYNNQAIKGLNSFIWRDRGAADTLDYTDSAVLLIWNQKKVSGKHLSLGSTEIGIVDSLEVVDASDTYGGGSGSGTGGDGIFYAMPNGCIEFDTLHQRDCNDFNYHPYTPDSLQLLFIITNTKNRTFNNVRIEVGNIPVDIKTAKNQNFIIPSTLINGTSAVATLTFWAYPRLNPSNFRIPVTMIGNVNDTLSIDTLCIFVPGIRAIDSLGLLNFIELCPTRRDTSSVPIYLKGVRCTDIDSIYLIGNTPDITYFSVINPKPSKLNPTFNDYVLIEFKPLTLGNFKVQLVARIKQNDDFPGGSTEFYSDTVDVTGIGKADEFEFAQNGDTLNFGHICVGDTAIQEWAIINKGGCEVDISSYTINGGKPNQFSLVNNSSFPLMIPRRDNGNVGKAIIRFTPVSAGSDLASLVINSTSYPYKDTLFLKGIGDIPDYLIKSNAVDFDTICPNQLMAKIASLENLTACPVDIDSVYIVSNNSGFSVTPDKFTIASYNDIQLNINATLATINSFTGKVFIRSAKGIDSSIIINAVVASRILQTAPQQNFGDVRIGNKGSIPVTINSSGTAGVVIDNIIIQGVHQQDYKVILPVGVNYPIYIRSANSLTFDVEFSPTDIENRQANVVFQMDQTKICGQPVPIPLKGRGIRPIIDIQNNKLYLGRVCIGKNIDTSFTVRNPGNGVLNILNYTPSGSDYFKLNGIFPLKVDSNSNTKLNIKFTPTLLGDFEAKINFASDGDWLFSNDSALHCYGTGIICAELYIDTIMANVGTIIPIPIILKSSAGISLTSPQLFNLMNSSNHRALSISVSHDRNLLRFNNDSFIYGAVSGKENKSIYPDSIAFTFDKGQSLLLDTTLATINAEVLLGDNYQTPLTISVKNFADGYSDLTIRNGLLIPQYCVIDKRFVDTKDVQEFLQVINNPAENELNLELFVQSGSRFTIEIIGGMNVVKSGIIEAKSGYNKLSIPLNGLVPGVYLIRINENPNLQDKFIILK